MEVQKLYNTIKAKLKTIDSSEEVESISLLLVEHYLQISRMDLMMNKEIELSEETQESIEIAIERLLNNEPIQHIIGKVEFYGRQFFVNRNVLIPRRETEELVHFILNQHPNLEQQHVIDIGTGSGIIPITIKKERSNSNVSALDVSTAALATAKRNALLNNAVINFFEHDILSSDTPPLEHQQHIFISNPPYVMPAEKGKMAPKVFEFEPELALFVKEDDPLEYYRSILTLAQEYLVPTGVIYFEINENLGKEMIALCVAHGFKNTKCYTDMQQKDRFIVAKRNTK